MCLAVLISPLVDEFGVGVTACLGARAAADIPVFGCMVYRKGSVGLIGYQASYLLASYLGFE